MASEDLINFDVIENQKENIQALPSGRSAKKLAELFSPLSLSKQSTAPTPTPSDTQSIHDRIRAEYEAEIVSISESDDPLDVYDRYVRWTLDAYPSAQATRQSRLHTLLERATRAFVGAAQYKNDPRYLRLWLHYIRLFSDAPREAFVFLSRHQIGDALALFYEEYAAWLETAGRWAQAEEVYKLGIEREARPAQRLLRKFAEFEQRRAQRGEDNADEPGSPALPSVRPALAAKIDPFAIAAAERDPQASRQNNGLGGGGSTSGQSSRPGGRSKLAIFSDADAVATAPAMSSRGTDSKGWENIGSLAERKKENVMGPKPMAGETLQAGGKKSSTSKMMVYRDMSLSQQINKAHIPIHHSQLQVTVNHNGKRERVFVDLHAVYPTPDEPGTELSFEEVWAANRGWLDRSWDDEDGEVSVEPSFVADENRVPSMDFLVVEKMPQKLVVHHDVIRLDENGAPVYPKEGRPRKKKVIEVNETQIIKAKLDSPSGRKSIKRRQSSEPTMTMHTKAATDDIYEIFNAPLKPASKENEAAAVADELGYETDDYTSGAESTVTTRICPSELGDREEEETELEEGLPEDETSDVKSVSEWSEFSTRKHIPLVGGDYDEEHNDTQVSDLIDIQDPEPSVLLSERPDLTAENPAAEDSPPRTRTVFIPVPPEDYVPPTRPYRDPIEVANSRLPFMTPITERTETSLDITSQNKSLYLLSNTPCRQDQDDALDARETGQEKDEDSIALEPLSSPLREVLSEPRPYEKMPQPQLQRCKPAVSKAVAPPKGPIIKDKQCNPMEDSIRDEILEHMHPALGSYEGFYDHRHEKYEKSGEIRKFVKAMMKGARSSTDKTGGVLGGSGATAVIQFSDTPNQYTVRKELGAGAFAPVYLVENSAPSATAEETGDGSAVMGRGAFAVAHQRRAMLEAVKMEEPPSVWEFHMMRLIHARLGPHHRATASLAPALEMHLYADAGFLVLPFFPHGSLLDVINLFRAEQSGTMDELLAMFFAVELLRTVEALHARGLMHGDLKPDNCLLRLPVSSSTSSAVASEPGGGGNGGTTATATTTTTSSTGSGDQPLAAQWRADGAGGWAARGITLIDFGRAIDMRAFTAEAQFIADWETSRLDCAEMREGRPWTWQIDYHGLAGVLHCLLFGKYMDTVRCDGVNGIGNGTSSSGGVGGGIGGGVLPSARRYRLRENLKRYWQTDIWAECFDLLLNPTASVADEEGARMPVLKGLRRVRERMEAWLEGNCERGVGLRGLMGRVEAWARGRR